MIYPQATNGAAGSAGNIKRVPRKCTTLAAEKKSGVARKIARGGNGSGGGKQLVQWKEKNVKEGIVIVDEQQLKKLIKREPIEKFYKLDPEPFATGIFASVRRCVSRATGEVFAAKFSSRARYGEDCSAEIHHEIALLSLCSPSSRVIKLHDVFETPKEIIILMEFAPGGDLQTIIDDNLVPFEADVVNFVRQLVEGLAYMHERKIAHLDIKPQNLVMMGDFPNCDVKLCDFEISRVILDSTDIREILGTPDYVAPEILHYEPITMAADLWSLGVTTYVLLTGFSPFGGETDQETFCNISRAQLDFPEELFEDVSEDAKDFIRKLLVSEPNARPSAKNLLRHRWLANRNSPKSANDQSKAPMSDNNRSNMSQKNLRKYLSKSREALFERVVQQQQQSQNRNNDLRKTTLLSQYNKTRLCESHMSLVSKSRENNPLNLSPSFSRSREKLYGLRSLSKSHEGLDLLKLSGKVVEKKGSTRAYSRAITADLSMLPLLRLQELSSNSSIASSEGTDLAKNEEVTEENIGEEHVVVPNEKQVVDIIDEIVKSQEKIEMVKQEDRGVMNVNTEPEISESVVEKLQKENEKIEEKIEEENMEEEKIKEENKAEKEDGMNKCMQLNGNMQKVEHSEVLDIIENVDEEIPRRKTSTVQRASPVASLLSPKLLIDTIGNNKFVKPSSGVPVVDIDVNNEEDKIGKNLIVPEVDKFAGKEMKDVKKGVWAKNEVHMKIEEPVVKFEVNEVRSLEDENAVSSEDVAIEMKVDTETLKKTENVSPEKSDEDEPKFSVAQLVSAYNRHQEVVTKSSLEVTMTANDKDLKIPAIIIEDPSTKFPTGPKALRLFIPDIDIEPSKKTKKNRTKSYRSLSRSSTQESLKVEEDNDIKEEEKEDAVKTNGELNGNINETFPVCNFVLEPPGDAINLKVEKRTEISPNYLRSSSLSSETSATSGCFTSESSGSTSWEDNSSPIPTKEDIQWKPTQKANKNVEVISGVNPWGRLCNGSYTRAMDKFNKNVDAVVTVEQEKPTRKVSLTMLCPPRTDNEEKVRRKSTSTMKHS